MKKKKIFTSVKKYLPQGTPLADGCNSRELVPVFHLNQIQNRSDAIFYKIQQLQIFVTVVFLTSALLRRPASSRVNSAGCDVGYVIHVIINMNK